MYKIIPVKTFFTYLIIKIIININYPTYLFRCLKNLIIQLNIIQIHSNKINSSVNWIINHPELIILVEMDRILQVWRNNWKDAENLCWTTVIYYNLWKSGILYWKSCWERNSWLRNFACTRSARLRGKIPWYFDRFNLKKPFKTDGWKENLFQFNKISELLDQLNLFSSLLFLKKYRILKDFL